MKKQEMKYEFTNDKKTLATGEVLYRIRALRDIDRQSVKVGDLGGYVQNPKTLSQDGDCWIGGNAFVYGDSVVKDNAFVGRDAVVVKKSVIEGEATVSINAHVSSSVIKGIACVTDEVSVYQSTIDGDSFLNGNATCEYCHITGKDVYITDKVKMSEVRVMGKEIYIRDKANIKSSVIGSEYASAEQVHILSNAFIQGCGVFGKNLFVLGDAKLTGAVKLSGIQVTVEGFAQIQGKVELGSFLTVQDFVKIDNTGNDIMEFKEETISGDILIQQ